MVNKRNTLGRGLGSLLNVSEKKVEESIFDEIQINKIEINKDQPRKSFNEEKIKELSLSIKQHGIIQPITVRRIDNDKFQLISGERRFRASKLIGNNTIPAFIRDTDDKNLLELALIENIQRENLNSIEIAISYKKLIDELKSKYTIVVVTHNMHQAARISQRTAFFHLGKLIEFDETDKIFTSPSEQKTNDYITGRYG